MADQVADSLKQKWQFEIHTDRFLLWDVRQTSWHVKWQIYTLPEMAIRDSYWWIPTLRAQEDQVADQMADLLPQKWQFEIPTDRFLILIDTYSESWGRPGGRSPLWNGNLRFLQIDLYSESSGKSSGIYTPQQWQFQIYTDRFLTLIDSYPDSSGRPGSR